MKQPPLQNTYELVVIGASSGGLEAIISILEGLENDFQIPLVFVLHQHRNAESLLVKVLAPHARIKVREPEDKEKVLPGHLYIAPPDYHLLLEPDMSFSYSYSEAVNFSRPSIDVFFETVADSLPNKAVGVLLTGANHDGAKGLAAIQQKGGMAIVQNPATAAYPQMPQAGVDAGCTAHITELKDIPLILNMLNKNYIIEYDGTRKDG